MNTARLIFEDGTVFSGTCFAGTGDRFGEVVFNTAMSGYQEVLTDPSYCGQIVLMTYPLIGNYGVNTADEESKKIYLSAFLVREYLDFPSNFRSERSLKDYLLTHDILGVEGMDTRAITRYIRDKGAQRAVLTSSDEPLEALLEKVKQSPSMVGQNLVKKVSTSKAYIWKGEKTSSSRFKVAAIDCGIKYNILRELHNLGCDCTVLPASTSAEEILGGGYDGVLLSNGPGDPEPVSDVVGTIKELLGKIPIFGICLGHQLLGLALGGKTRKLTFGHHGANHPVKNLKTGQVEVTSQNHGFVLDVESLDKDDIEITHMNLNDQTLEGFRHKTYPAFAVQYHPEAAPGPHDSLYLFGEFLEMMGAR